MKEPPERQIRSEKFLFAREDSKEKILGSVSLYKMYIIYVVRRRGEVMSNRRSDKEEKTQKKAHFYSLSDFADTSDLYEDLLARV